MTSSKTSILAAGLLALSGGVAAANPAVTQSDIHLRAGPGPSYGVVAVVPRGAPVEAWNCDGAWCKVNFNGRIGFSSERYLDIGRTTQARRTVREPVTVAPAIAAPVVSRRVVTQPLVTEQVVTEPIVTEPVVTEPVVTEQVVTGPAYVAPAQPGYVVPQYGQRLTQPPVTVTEQTYVRPAYRTYAYEEAAPAYEPAPVVTTPVVAPLTPWRGW